jgi:hypothetical protein
MRTTVPSEAAGHHDPENVNDDDADGTTRDPNLVIGEDSTGSETESDEKLDNLQRALRDYMAMNPGKTVKFVPNQGGVVLPNSELLLGNTQDDPSVLTLETYQSDIVSVSTMETRISSDRRTRLVAIDEQPSVSSSEHEEPMHNTLPASTAPSPPSLPHHRMENNPYRGEFAEVKLGHEEAGWTRCITKDFKFRWKRLKNEDGDMDKIERFDADRSAYVLKLEYLDDNDKLRKGRCSLVNAEHGVVEKWVKSINGTDLVSHSDIVNAQMMNLDDKVRWFQDTCIKLGEDWNRGYMRINVRREFLLEDSIEAVMGLSRKELHKVWRFEFIGEADIDAGGVARKWFEHVTKRVFDPAMGLWKPYGSNQMCLEINPASGE